MNLSLILMFIALASVLATLVIGVVGMARGGEFNRKHGNRLMRMRVMLQGAAIALLALAIYMRG
ncbi:MAG TPA: twin transmembrane helix small protein [Alphaproteobacteria bacterium]|nr:twin transmembrane helix small protein [Alphaproteobacteria bacterium]